MAIEVQNKSLLKIIYSVQEQLNGFNITDDTLYDEVYLKDMANVFRAALIKEDILQTKILADSYYQSMCCLEVLCRKQSCVVGSETIYSGDMEYYVELPKLIGGIGWADIKYLGLADFKTAFTRKNLLGYNSIEGDRYGREKPVFTIIGKEAKLNKLPSRGLKYICLIGILDDPTTSCTWDTDIEYPLPNYLIAKLEMLMLKQILSTRGISPDFKNDAQPLNVQQNTQQPNINNE